MTWTSWILASALFLALYDLAKKASVRENAVLPVLLFATLFGTAAYVLGLAVSGRLACVAAVDGRILALAASKALIVAVSWIFTFCALRTLPISIATPIRASAPALVFLVALPLYGERPTLLQGLGMLSVFTGYFAFSWAGKHEGIDFFRNRAVWCAFAGALCSAVSALWDKYVFQVAAAPVEAMQFWFQIGLVAVYGGLLAATWAWRRASGEGREEGRADGFAKGSRRSAGATNSTVSGICRTGDAGGAASPPGGAAPRLFQWRWTIPFVGVFLVCADWLYFTGIAGEGVPISTASLLRRVSVVVTFVLGAKFFHETNLLRKGLALAAILVGVALIVNR